MISKCDAHFLLLSSQVREYVMAMTSEQTAAQMNAVHAVRQALSNPYFDGQLTKTLQLHEAIVGTRYGPGGFWYFGVDQSEPGMSEKTSRRVLDAERLFPNNVVNPTWISKPEDVSSSTPSSFWVIWHFLLTFASENTNERT